MEEGSRSTMVRREEVDGEAMERTCVTIAKSNHSDAVRLTSHGMWHSL